MRQATPEDVPGIRKKLEELQRKSPAPMIRHCDLDSAESGVRDAITEGRGVFFGAYFLMYSAGIPWFSKKVHLAEELLLKVYDDDPSWTLSRVLQEGLLSLAKQHHAEVLVVGDSQIGYMAPRYEAAGFSRAGVELMKEL